MSSPVRLLREARDEFDVASGWYENQQRGLGQVFVSRVREVLQRIAANPRVHATI